MLNNAEKRAKNKIINGVLRMKDSNSPIFQERNKKKRKIATMVSAVICVYIVFVTAGLMLNDKTSNQPIPSDTPSVEEVEYIEITASELYNAFRENEIRAEQNYKGKHLKVTGEIIEISSGGTFQSPCIVLDVESNVLFGNVQCNFPDKEEAKKIAQISKGQTVSILGICDDLGEFNLNINGCRIE